MLFAVQAPAYLGDMGGVVQIPFGGSFYNLVQWCAWSEESSGKVRLQVSCDVIYTKRWVPAKGIINSSSIEVGTPGPHSQSTVCTVFVFASVMLHPIDKTDATQISLVEQQLCQQFLPLRHF